MKFLVVVVLGAMCSVMQAQTRIDVTITVDSVQRELILAIPSGTAPADGYPLVFMFHGSSLRGEQTFDESGWKEKGEAEKFISVFPTALRYCMIDNGDQYMGTKWHNGELEDLACPGQNLKSDINFVRAMIDSIAARFPINRRKIFATGASNGACMAQKLAVDMSDVFAAVAGCSDDLNGRDTGNPTRNIPVWFVLGTKDGFWLPHYGLDEFPFNDSILIVMRSVIRRYLNVFNLDTAHARIEAGRTLTYVYNTPSSPEPTAEFRFSMIRDMPHMYPNGTNFPLVAADAFWDFFTQSTSSAPLQQPPAPMSHLYPNPTDDYLVVGCDGSVRITLVDILGQVVLSSQAVKGARIDLRSLAEGTYVAVVTTGLNTSSTLVQVRR